MRKALILLITLILIAVLAWFAIQGVDSPNIKILSYTQVGEESAKLELNIDEYEKINLNQLKEKQDIIKQEAQTYEEIREDYKTRLAQREANLAQMGTGNLSDIDFLLVKVGNYATEHKLNLLFELTKNVSDANADQYIVTDLNFKVEGIYFEIAQFIDKLEKDEKLSFEIRDFKMVNGGSSSLVTEGIEDGEVSPTVIDPKTGLPVLQKQGEEEKPIYNIVTATFKVCGIPIKKSTLLEISTTASTTNTTNTANATNTSN